MEKPFQLYIGGLTISNDIYKRILPDMLELYTLDPRIKPDEYILFYKNTFAIEGKTESLPLDVHKYLSLYCKDYNQYKITLIHTNGCGRNRLDENECVIGYGLLKKGFRLYLLDCWDPFSYYITSTVLSVDKTIFHTKNSHYKFIRYEHTNSKQIK